MELNTIQQLLQKAQPILQKSKAEKKEREAKGEYFNALKICILHALRNICIPLFFVCC